MPRFRLTHSRSNLRGIKILLLAKFRSFTRNPKILRSLVPVLVYKGLELANLLRLNDLAGSRLGLRFTK